MPGRNKTTAAYADEVDSMVGLDEDRYLLGP